MIILRKLRLKFFDMGTGKSESDCAADDDWGQ
jgi:hypothetical protein